MILRKVAILSMCTLSALMAGFANAGEFARQDQRQSHHGQTSHHRERHNHRPSDSGVVVAPGLVSVIPGLGTFSGAITAVRVRKNGNYFLHDGGLRGAGAPALAPRARVIVVDESNNACSYEAGVCVVRP